MPARQPPEAIGAARGRYLRQRLASEFLAARLAAGLSQREVARRLRVSAGRLARVERGDDGPMTVDLLARYAAALGLELAASLHPNGDPIRDRGHLELIRRFRARLARNLRWRAEVVVPIPGDARSGDGIVNGDGWDGLVEAETRLGDVQLLERRAAAKQRDLGADRLILLVSDTRHNRTVLRLHPELRERFPIDQRTCLRALSRGRDPDGDAIVVL